MKNKKAVGIIAIMLGVLVALIPKVIFPVCTDMIELINGKTLYMKCHWSAMAELLIGWLTVFNGILILVFKRHETQIALSIMLILLGLAALLIPTIVIGMCKAPTMACRVGTKPALIVMSVIIMILGAGNNFLNICYIKSQQLYKERSVIK